MNPKRCYSAIVAWSVQDGEYVATCPEWPGLSGIDRDPGEAIDQLFEAVDMAIEVYEEEKRDLPAPKYLPEGTRE